MPDNLTQEQIDALFFGGMSDAEEESVAAEAETPASILEKKVRPYDFKNPKTFPREHIRIINLVHESYAKHLSSFLSGILRTECSLNIANIEELKYHEYRDILPSAVMLAIIELSPIEGNVLLDIRREMCYTIIDRLLGGTGENVAVSDDFTDIELKILGTFCEQIISFFKDAWSNVTEVEPEFKRIETNSRLSQLMPLEDTVIVIAMEIKILNHTSTLSICLPCYSLEDVLSTTSIYMMNSRRSKEDPEETRKSILSNLQNTKVDVRGILGTTNLSLKDLLQLQVGDYITLDKPVENPVILKIGPTNWFDGEVGTTKRNKMAVKIKNVLESI